MVAKTTADIPDCDATLYAQGMKFSVKVPWDEVWFPSGERHDAEPLPGIDLKPVIVTLTLRDESHDNLRAIFDILEAIYVSNLQSIADASEKELSSSADSSEAGL